MRVRAPVNRGRRRAAEGFMADDVSRMVFRVMAGVLLAGFALGGCVQSKTQLVSGTKPLLGEQFNLNAFEDFTEGKAVTVKTGVYRWSGTRYARVTGDVSGVKFFSFAPLDDSDYLVEATDDKDYAFLLAHRLAEGTYRIWSTKRTST
ncbi:MAG TPA: hypothetical protein VGI22_05095 [Xanthobacteraceae bacterium]|jgi:hypothetical protein